MDGKAIKPIILSIVKKANDINLEVTAVTSDMGSCNRAMWNSFGITSSRTSTVDTRYRTISSIP